ncbi:hypothetical protein ACJ73_07692 [Blastomyces percursus]|uniref:Uncharacterized protein n=1 Tax=Blastomyces percursus TaxID=1658174 RepID=A0A1J9QL69_9EURO|nr:hypothetical protein ACJ73_07692 [Blastomyces percursus]
MVTAWLRDGIRTGLRVIHSLVLRLMSARERIKELEACLRENNIPFLERPLESGSPPTADTFNKTQSSVDLFNAHFEELVDETSDFVSVAYSAQNV